MSDLSRLLEYITEAAEEGRCTPAEAVHQVGQILAGGGGDAGASQHASLATLADRVRRLRMKRNELLGAPLFKDPAWDMLLELFAAHESGRDISVNSLCYASGVPATTALRYLTRMEEHGLITREGDPCDMRRCYIRPTQKAIDGLVQAGQLLLNNVQMVERLARASRRCEANDDRDFAAPLRSSGR